MSSSSSSLSSSLLVRMSKGPFTYEVPTLPDYLTPATGLSKSSLYQELSSLELVNDRIIFRFPYFGSFGHFGCFGTETSLPKHRKLINFGRKSYFHGNIFRCFGKNTFWSITYWNPVPFEKSAFGAPTKHRGRHM